MKAFKAILIVIFVAAIASQFSSNPYDPTQSQTHAPGQHNPNAGGVHNPNAGGVHNPNAGAGANHVFLVKTDLTKEQVEALLKRAEVEAAMEPEEPIEQPEIEQVEPEQVEPEAEEPITTGKGKAAHKGASQQHGGNKKSAHSTQALETEILAGQDPTTGGHQKKTKEQKMQGKADKAAQKQADMEAQRQGKNAKAEQKKADQLAKQKQKEEKAAMKVNNAEMKKAEKEQKVLDKQNKKLTEEPATEILPETEEMVQSNPAHASGMHNKKASKTNTPVAEEITVVTEIDEEALTELKGGQAAKGGKSGKGSTQHAQGQGTTQQQRDRKRIHTPKQTEPEVTSEPNEAEMTPQPTNLLKMTDPKKEVSVSSFVALFMILFTFVALILLATQYESVKRHFKLDIKNEGLTDYLLVDERHEERRSDYPNIRDF